MCYEVSQVRIWDFYVNFMDFLSIYLGFLGIFGGISWDIQRYFSEKGYGIFFEYFPLDQGDTSLPC